MTNPTPTQPTEARRAEIAERAERATPHVWYICDVCADNCPESSGNSYADEIAVVDGKHYCAGCYDEIRSQDGTPHFSDAQHPGDVDEAFSDRAWLLAELIRLEAALAAREGD